MISLAMVQIKDEEEEARREIKEAKENINNTLRIQQIKGGISPEDAKFLRKRL